MKISENAAQLAVKIAGLYPEINAYQAVRVASEFERYGRAALRIAEDQCNRQPRTGSPDEFERRADRLKTKITALQKEYRVSFNFRLNGDPRGYGLYLIDHRLGGNTMGGVENGWGI